MKRRARLFLLSFLCVGAQAIEPRTQMMELEVAPAWTVTALDEKGNPMPGLIVEEHWNFYGMNYQGDDTATTDANGKVVFPRRSLKASRSDYQLNKAKSHLNIHSSFHPGATIRIHPENLKEVESYYSSKKIYDRAGATTKKTETGLESVFIAASLDIFDYIGKKDWSTVKQIITSTPSIVSFHDRYGSSPLISMAVYEFQGEVADILRLLIKNGANINDQAKDGTTALHQVAKNHDLEGMKFLLSNKAAVNIKIHDSVYYTTNGFTPLHFQLGAYGLGLKMTAASDRIAGINLLLDHGADVNAKDNNGDTPLHLAAVWGDPKIVEALISRGADPLLKNCTGKTPLESIRSLRDTPKVMEIKRRLREEEAKRSK